MSNVKRLRPSDLLTLFAKKNLSRDFFSEIPDGDIGSTSMLEKLMLIVLGRVIKANTVFEFGTFKGETTKLFISNKIGKTLTSLDLDYFDGQVDRRDFNLLNDEENDAFLTKSRMATVDSDVKILADTSGISVELIKQNSMTLDISNRKQQYDLIFIDGGHTAEIIENDTNLALQMLSKKGCLVWHDYGSQIHTDVTAYLDRVSNNRDLFSIGSTSLVFYAKNKDLVDELAKT